jgi:hypothetical protein
MVFNFVDPCQEIVFEGDVIERGQTFKNLGILLETPLEFGQCNGTSRSCQQVLTVRIEPLLCEVTYYGR